MSLIFKAPFGAALLCFALAACSSPVTAEATANAPVLGIDLGRAPAEKSIVAVRLTHTADGKPVLGAIIIQTRADMGPNGMREMTAAVKAPPREERGIYRFEVETGLTGGC